MPKLPRRTEAELTADLSTLLNQSLHEDTKRGLCWKLIWDFTELQGRWKNPNFRWSRGAVDRLTLNRSAGNGWFSGLRREHSYPMSLSIGELIVPNLPADEVERLLRRASAVVVLTLPEARAVDRKHKATWPDGADRWDLDARYRTVSEPSIDILASDTRPWEDIPDSAQEVDPNELEPIPPEES